MKHRYSITGMTCSTCTETVKERLEQHTHITSADVDLERKEAVLTMSEHIATQALQNLLGMGGKYSIAEISIPLEGAPKSSLETFKPLILIFLFISAVSGIASTRSGEMDVMKWMNYFMAGFFLTFSFFKFLDLRSFAGSYSGYDLLAKKVRSYGFIYPFIELALGLAYLTAFKPELTAIVTIVVMGFSSLGVIHSVLDKRKIRCACLGAVFNLPMTTVTIVEDLLMVAMAAFVLLYA